MRALGFKDAFVKSVRAVMLEEVTAFETGYIPPKKPVAKRSDRPKTYEHTPQVIEKKKNKKGDSPVLYSYEDEEKDKESPVTYDYKGDGRVKTTVPARSVALPTIRSKPKRESVRDLQKVLKVVKNL